jgi:hypothetical protein
MSRPEPTTGRAPEVRRGQVSTWIALVLITVGTAAASLVDPAASPVVQGLFAMVAALEVMVAWWWWRRRG